MLTLSVAMSKPVTRKLLVTEQQRQRQAHIAHADNSDTRLPGFDPLLEILDCAFDGRGHVLDSMEASVHGCDAEHKAYELNCTMVQPMRVRFIVGQ